MDFVLEPNNRGLTDEEIIDDVKSVAKKLNKETLTMKEYDDLGIIHSTSVTRRLGSWFSVLEKAGLKPSRSKINIPLKSLFENLGNVWVYLERQPRYSDMQKPLSKYSAGTYENRFGTWRNALESFVKYVNNEGDYLTTAKTKNKKESSTTKHKTKRSINWRLRFLVMRRDNFKCKACGRNPAANPDIVLHVDHIVPWAEGGETVLDNLQTLCSKCNIGKSNIPMQESGS